MKTSRLGWSLVPGSESDVRNRMRQRSPVAAAAPPVTAAAPIAAAPVTTTHISSARVIPRCAAAGIVVGADNGVATLVGRRGRVGRVAGISRAVLSVPAAGELVV